MTSRSLGNVPRTTFRIEEVLGSLDLRWLPEDPFLVDLGVPTESQLYCINPEEGIPMYDMSVYPPKLNPTAIARRVDNCTEGTPQEVWQSAVSGNREAHVHMFGDTKNKVERCQGDCLNWCRDNLRK